MTTLPDVLPLLGLDGITLKGGGHGDRQAGVCLLEAAAWVAGEPHSDHPVCVCPVMAAFGRSWNDALPDDETRTRLLKPVVSLLIGTKSTPAVALQRSYLAFDWLVRVHVPTWMDLTPSLASYSDALRALAPLTDQASVVAAAQPLAAARSAARSAAGAAAWAAAGAAARAAAWAAAEDADGDAAWAAAGDAAGAAAARKLTLTVTALQASALDLLHRMAAIKE